MARPYNDIRYNHASAREQYTAGETYYSSAGAASLSGNSGRVGQNAPMGFIDWHLKKFDDMARGRVANKYNVSFYGPYVEQALLIMERNSQEDKYDSRSQKIFYGQLARFECFKAWLSMFFDSTSKTLNTYWAVSDVSIPGATAEIEAVPMDTIKGMTFPVVKKVSTGVSNTISITVIDDPFMMWYQFFNALFNTQFTPLILKPTTSFHMINIRVNEFTELVSVSDKMRLTDAHIGQMYEFNTCVMKQAPGASLSFRDNPKQVSYKIEFQFPNAFQGSFKERLRLMQDNTTCDDSAVTNDGDYITEYFEGNPLDENFGPNTYAAYRTSTKDDINNKVPALNASRKHADKLVGWTGYVYSPPNKIAPTI